MYMIDTHCHLVDNKFKSDIDEVVERAKASSVKHAVVCPEYASQFEAVLILKDRHPDFVLPAIGVHPIQVREVSLLLYQRSHDRFVEKEQIGAGRRHCRR